jgi:hypothetical protein
MPRSFSPGTLGVLVLGIQAAALSSNHLTLSTLSVHFQSAGRQTRRVLFEAGQ